MSYRDNLDALAARHAALETEVAHKTRELDAAARMLEEARTKAKLRLLDNIRVALDHGLTVFDASVGGIGGCPYAPGARGNVDTLAVADMLAAAGYETGLDREKLAAAAAFARRITGKGDVRKSA